MSQCTKKLFWEEFITFLPNICFHGVRHLLYISSMTKKKDQKKKLPKEYEDKKMPKMIVKCFSISNEVK